MYLPQPTESTFAPPPSGTHVAICYRFIDLGTQIVEWQGSKKTQRKVLISWELPTELMEDGRPFTISKRYTWSMSDKASLRHDLEAWRGKSFTEADFIGPNRFDIKNILGKACLLTIVHVTKDGNTYANIKGVSALPKGMGAPAPVSESVYLALTPEEFDGDVFEGLSEKIKQTIQGSPEWGVINGITAAPQPNGDESFYDDPVPF